MKQAQNTPGNRSGLRHPVGPEPLRADLTRVLELTPSGDTLAALPYEVRGRVRAELADIPGAMDDWQAAAVLYLQAGDAAHHQRVQELLSRYAS
jgi:hypothetical protein